MDTRSRMDKCIVYNRIYNLYFRLSQVYTITLNLMEISPLETLIFCIRI